MKKASGSFEIRSGLSDELLEYGLVNYLEALTTEDQATNKELNVIDNQYNQNNSIISFYRLWAVEIKI